MKRNLFWIAEHVGLLFDHDADFTRRVRGCSALGQCLPMQLRLQGLVYPIAVTTSA